MRHAPEIGDRWFGLPLGGFVTRLLGPAAYPFPPALWWLATALDYAALAGMLAAFALSLRLLVRRDFSAGALAALLFTLLGVFLTFPVWDHAYAFGRAFSPLLVLLAMAGFASRSWWMAAPLAMVFPRVALQLGGQALGVLRGLFLT